MGYYGNSQPNFAGVGKPYSASDILASTNAMAGALTNQSDLMAKDRKNEQMAEANTYVSGLLGKGDTASLKQARGMLPYASDAMQKQAQFVADDLYKAQQQENWAKDFQNKLDEQKITHEQWNKTFEENKRQFGETKALQIQQMKNSYALGMAGIAEQKAARMDNNKMMRDYRNAQLDLKATEYNTGLINNGMTSLGTNIDAALSQGTGMFNWANVDADKAVQIKNLAGAKYMQLVKSGVDPRSAAALVTQKVTAQMSPSYSSSTLLGRVEKSLK